MAKFVYKGKVNGNDVVYKDGCFHGLVDKMEGDFYQNIMEVVTETGRKFKFRSWLEYNSILESLEENTYLPNDIVNEVIIKEKGKKKLSYCLREVGDRTEEEKRARIVLEKAKEMYNRIRQEIVNDLKKQNPSSWKPKGKKLEKRVLTEDEIRSEVEDIFNTDSKVYGLRLYRGDAKRFMKFFSKIDKSRKKELLNEIFSCEYENKEVIEWLNKNELGLLREAGFNG